MKKCMVENCERGMRRNGLCTMHSSRVRRTGSTGPAGFILDPRRRTADRIYPRLVAIGNSVEWDCWEWQGALRRGYATVRIGKKVIYVHRWIYEDMIAEIPDGLVLDHMCCNNKCANPFHLDPITCEENVRRGGYSTGYRRVA